MDERRHKGKVAWFKSTLGYGFIIPDDKNITNGKELFTHFHYVVQAGFKTLYEGDSVEFSLGENERGLCAVDVKVLERARKQPTRREYVPAISD